MPLFPRMFYSDAGRPFQPGTVDLTFMFNTEGDCKRSYVTVAHELEIHMFLCTQTKIQTYDASNNTEFVHYVQKCPAVITRDK